MKCRLGAVTLDKHQRKAIGAFLALDGPAKRKDVRRLAADLVRVAIDDAMRAYTARVAPELPFIPQEEPAPCDDSSLRLR